MRPTTKSCTICDEIALFYEKYNPDLILSTLSIKSDPLAIPLFHSTFNPETAKLTASYPTEPIKLEVRLPIPEKSRHTPFEVPPNKGFFAKLFE